MRDPLYDAVLDLAIAAGIGAVAGLRSMTAPAVVALAMNQQRMSAPSSKFRFLEGKKTATVLTAMAIGELITDKFPGVPDRTSPPALLVRVGTGAFAAAALSASRGRSVAAGAVAGGLGAIAGSFLGFNTRKRVVEKTKAKDAVIAVIEDGIAVGGGLLLAAS